jgi:hypothetical protein
MNVIYHLNTAFQLFSIFSVDVFIKNSNFFMSCLSHLILFDIIDILVLRGRNEFWLH